MNLQELLTYLEVIDPSFEISRHTDDKNIYHIRLGTKFNRVEISAPTLLETIEKTLKITGYL